MPDIETIALIGAGRMGQGIGRNLLLHGFTLRAFDVTPEAREIMRELGANVADSVSDATEGAQVVITCLPNVASVRAVYLGPDGLIERVNSGVLLIDMTSSSPALTRELGTLARAKGIGMVDAPLLRGVQQAWDGTVHILLAGSPADRARSLPVLKPVAEQVKEVGALGNAHALKAMNNAVTMTNAAVIGEVFHVGRRLGFSAQIVADVLSGGLGNSEILKLYAPRIASDEHPRSGSIYFGEKDLGLFLDIAQEAESSTPVLAAAYGLYRLMCDRDAGAEAPSRLADLLDIEAAPQRTAG